VLRPPLKLKRRSLIAVATLTLLNVIARRNTPTRRDIIARRSIIALRTLRSRTSHPRQV
jgi:hypothetical protein